MSFSMMRFLGADSLRGRYVQFRVMKHSKKHPEKLFNLAQFWTDRELQKINPDRVYFFSPGLRGFESNDVVGSWVAFVDVDSTRLPGFPASFRPSLIVSSGGGFHVYWRFSSFVVSDDLKGVLSELVRVVPGADVKCRDVTRFLRFPGSYNLKYNPPAMCRVISSPGFCYDYSHFLGVLRSLPSASPPRARARPGRSSPSVPPTLTLYHRDTGRNSSEYRWYFWQKSQPYQIGQGSVIPEEVSTDLQCVVFALGGATELWRGRLADVPQDLRGYLAEVQVFFE